MSASARLHVGPATRWCPSRVLAAATLGAWAGLFWWLLAAGRTPLYLSSRTAWVVPLGAALLSVATLGTLASARARAPQPIEPRSALGVVVVVLPVVLVVAMPPASLGSYAAERRSTLAGAGAPGSSEEDIASGRVTLIDVAGALRSREGMRALAARAGSRVDFVGFVDRRGALPADEFLLTRFLVTCCAADALSLQVRVVGAPPGRFSNDQWVRVTGTIYPLGREVLVDASEVRSVERPARPYLNG